MLGIVVALLVTATIASAGAERVNYSGHKVLSVTPKSEEDIQFLLKLRSDYGVDLWNEPTVLNIPVLIRLKPELVEPVQDALRKKRIDFDVAIYDLQSTILAERIQNAPAQSEESAEFDFGRYNEYDKIVQLLKDLSNKYPKISKLEILGKTYENRPIYSLKISSGNSTNKPAIMMECGLHAREWTSVAAGAYLVNRLITTYGEDPIVTGLVDKYEFNIVVESNPDGYVYTWLHDRLWRKTRSHSSIDWLGVCRGADANRNFDVEHCGVGTSRKPCEEEFCGDKPFSESESRALRDLMISLGSRLKAYFSLHAYSQLWMTPYGSTKKLPPNYDELKRIGEIGVAALAKKYGTQFTFGTVANIIYEATGSSIEYAYVKEDVPIVYALELRDQGRRGFFLNPKDILPACEETFDGIQAATLAL